MSKDNKPRAPAETSCFQVSFWGRRVLRLCGRRTLPLWCPDSPPWYHFASFTLAEPQLILYRERDLLERRTIHPVFLVTTWLDRQHLQPGPKTSKADSGCSATFTLSIHEEILADRNLALV